MADIVRKHAKELARVIASSFSLSGVNELSATKEIVYSDLPWQNPPLQSGLTLQGVCLDHYLDAPIATSEEALIKFWVRTLDDLYQRRDTAFKGGSYAAANHLLSRISLGLKSLRFSTPSGWYTDMDDTAGVSFSLEVAHTARISLPISEFVAEGDDYYAVLPSGRKIGVEGGLPATSSDWDIPATGLVPDLLAMPRGQVSYSSNFDQVDLARSLLWEHKKLFPEWQALDYAVQGIRSMTRGSYSYPLIGDSAGDVIEARTLKVKFSAVTQALEVLEIQSISDRAKILTIEQLLVPDVMTLNAFRRRLFDTSREIPFAIRNSTMQKILGRIEVIYSKFPQQLKDSEHVR